MKLIIICYLAMLSMIGYSQNLDELRIKKYHSFLDYLKKVDSTKIDLNYITEKFVDVSYIQPDTDSSRLNNRMAYLRKFVIALQQSVKSMNVDDVRIEPLQKIKNYDARVISKIKQIDGDIYGIQLISNPTLRYNWLLYQPGSDKVISWTLMDLGGAYHFLKLNLVGNYKKL